MATTVMQYNVNTIKARMIELKRFLYNATTKPDVVYLQETCLKSTDTFEMQGHNVIRKDRADHIKGGGVATLIKAGLNYKEIMNKSSMEYVTIELCNTIPIKIINIYISPTTDIDKKSI